MSTAIWYDGKPAMVGGWTNLGPIQIPPLPTNLILTDRDTGQLWLVSFTTAIATVDNLGYITINTTLPSQDKTIYPAYSEPYIKGSFGQYRLIVRGGYLGVDIASTAHDTDRENGRLMARAGLLRNFREIYMSVITPGQIAWTQVTT